MNSPQPLSKEAEFKKFYDLAYTSCHMFRNYYSLYEQSEERIGFLNTCASPFFGDLQLMWHENLILDICRLTDNRKDAFSIKYWINQLPDKTAAKKLEAELLKTRKLVAPARNQITAHCSVQAIREDKPLGALPGGAVDIERFYRNLETLLGVIAKHIYTDPNCHVWPLDATGNDGDVLISLLERGKKYNNLIQNHPELLLIDDKPTKQ
jgi:hypothetical protein